MSDYFPTTGQAAMLEHILEEIATMPDDMCINLKTYARMRLEQHRAAQLQHYMQYETERRAREGVDWA